MGKRLKLYDNVILVYMSSSDKERIRSLAYSRNLTISEYIRNLIFIELGRSELKNMNMEDDDCSDKEES